MKIKLDILRRENSTSEPYRHTVIFETEDINATMAKFEKNVIDKNTVSQFSNTPLRSISYAVIRYDNETVIKITDNISKKVIMANIKRIMK